MVLNCSLCDEDKDYSEFTKFSKNPIYKEFKYRCPICKTCCIEYVEKRGNTKDSLREILRLQDIPYIESYADSALKAYQKKLDNTNIIIAKNVHTDEETEVGEENIRLQTSIYTCYTSRLGLMPKEYINYMYSDGLRKDVVKEKLSVEDSEKKKAITSAKRFMTKTFTKAIAEDNVKLPKAVKLMIEEIDLHTNNTNKRQLKHRMKSHIRVLVEADLLPYEDYSYLLDEVVESETEDMLVVNVNKEDMIKEEEVIDDEYLGFINPLDKIKKIPLDILKYKWGDTFPPNSLYKFEAEYDTLKKNYTIKTAQHDKFLKMACIASVQMVEKLASGEVAEAQKLSSIFEKMTLGGKLQPSQMSKADLAGGMNNFSEFYKTLEEANGVIEILPEYLKQPKDDADFVLYCNVLYARRLMGYSDCEYGEIYEFYNEIKSSQEGDEESIEDLIRDYNDGDEDDDEATETTSEE